jgi:adenylate cyclase, class 2
MTYEVEQKHRVENVALLVAALEEKGAKFGEPIHQSDIYYAHPCRNFAETDEALRIRAVGDESFVTYKGPKVDTTTKTRREIELPLDPNDKDGAQFASLLRELGFKRVAIVRKQRRPFRIDVDDVEVDGALDDVDSVGSFVELELQADDAGLEAAKRTISKLATELGLGPSERRSYLEMLVERQSLPPGN